MNGEVFFTKKEYDHICKEEENCHTRTRTRLEHEGIWWKLWSWGHPNSLCKSVFLKFNLKLVNKAMVTVFPMGDILFGKASAWVVSNSNLEIKISWCQRLVQYTICHKVQKD